MRAAISSLRCGRYTTRSSNSPWETSARSHDSSSCSKFCVDISVRTEQLDQIQVSVASSFSVSGKKKRDKEEGVNFCSGATECHLNQNNQRRRRDCFCGERGREAGEKERESTIGAKARGDDLIMWTGINRARSLQLKMPKIHDSGNGISRDLSRWPH